MRTIDWAPLDDALRALRASGRTLTVWWRDDDAVADTPALDRLLRLAERTGWPIGLAVVPSAIEPSLAPRLRSAPAHVLVHGFAHRNHAVLPAKRAEFGDDRPVAEAVAEAAASLAIMRDTELPWLPVFVPPWNRIAVSLVPLLAGLGYRGLSAFGNGVFENAGLIQVNTHLDPVAWHRAGRGLVEPSALMTELCGAIRRRIDGLHETSPFGLLTHHLVHDEATWDFCEALADRLAMAPNVQRPSADILFGACAIGRGDEG